MTTTFTKEFFSGDLVQGAEQGIVELIGIINLSASYVTGGFAVDFSAVHANCDMANLISIEIAPSFDGLNECVFIEATDKIKALVKATGAEVANATDLSAAAKTHRLRAVFRVSTAVSTAYTVDA
jgi:hypothetical protein